MHFIFSVANSGRLIISLAILFSNPLQFYVAISIIFPTLMAPYIKRQNHVKAEYVLRYFIMLFCCKYLKKDPWLYSWLISPILDGMALLVPDLDLFISLSGAICMSTLSIITPALLDNAVHELSTLWKVKNWILVTFGIGISIFGTIMSLKDLIKRHD